MMIYIGLVDRLVKFRIVVILLILFGQIIVSPIIQYTYILTGGQCHSEDFIGSLVSLDIPVAKK